MMNLVIIIVLLVLSLLLNIYFGIKLYQFSTIIMNLEDSIEDSLDVLDERYKSLYEIIQKPIFFDSIEVRQAINDIKVSHDAILRVANKLTYDSGIKVEKPDEIDKKDV